MNLCQAEKALTLLRNRELAEAGLSQKEVW
jgi:hypothetical protein